MYHNAPQQNKKETANTMEKVVISANNMAEYNRLKAQGGKVLWVGEGKICFEVKILK